MCNIYEVFGKFSLMVIFALWSSLMVTHIRPSGFYLFNLLILALRPCLFTETSFAFVLCSAQLFYHMLYLIKTTVQCFCLFFQLKFYSILNRFKFQTKSVMGEKSFLYPKDLKDILRIKFWKEIALYSKHLQALF